MGSYVNGRYVMGRCPECQVWTACQEADGMFIGNCPCGTSFEVDEHGHAFEWWLDVR